MQTGNEILTGSIPNQSLTWEEMDAAFKLVQPKPHWKGRIDMLIEAENQDAVSEAIIFYTGSVPSFTKCCNAKACKDWVRVQAAGYYATIGS